MKAEYYIGIDTGVNTGFAVWDTRQRILMEVSTMTITQAMERVREIVVRLGPVHLFIEDARLRKWFGNAGREQLQGAGSIKRDAAIWEQFCLENGYAYTLVPPKNNATKMSAEAFSNLTSWTGRTSEHARDAAMMIFGQ